MATETCSTLSVHEDSTLLEIIGEKNHEIIKLKAQLKRQSTLNAITRKSLAAKFVINKPLKQRRPWSIDDVKDNELYFKFYTGLTYPQFEILWEFLGSSRNKLLSWASMRKGHLATATIKKARTIA